MNTLFILLSLITSFISTFVYATPSITELAWYEGNVNSPKIYNNPSLCKVKEVIGVWEIIIDQSSEETDQFTTGIYGVTAKDNLAFFSLKTFKGSDLFKTDAIDPHIVTMSATVDVALTQVYVFVIEGTWTDTDTIKSLLDGEKGKTREGKQVTIPNGVTVTSYIQETTFTGASGKTNSVFPPAYNTGNEAETGEATLNRQDITGCSSSSTSSSSSSSSSNS